MSNGEEERWAPIPGAMGKYLISDFGNVMSLCCRKRRLLRPHKDKRGYYRVSIWLGNRKLDGVVHNLVLQAFVGPMPKGMIGGGHLDGSRTNNCLSNLKWVTHQENMDHRRLHGTHPSGELNANAKLKNKDMGKIFEMARAGVPRRDIAKWFKINESAINRIISGTAWGIYTEKFRAMGGYEKFYRPQNPRNDAAIWRLIDKGLSVRQIAKELRVTYRTIARARRERENAK